MKKHLLIAFLMLSVFLGCSSSVRAQNVLSISPAGVVQAPVDQQGWRNFKLTLTQTVTSFQFVGTPPPAQAGVTVIFTENATGGFTVAFASNISNPCTVTTTANATTLCQFNFDGTTNTWIGVGSSGSGLPAGSVVAGTIVQSGLMAQYRILPTETAAALVDYSGNGRNATGTAGTAPTIIAGTGGLSCINGNGAVILPASLNTAVSIQVLMQTSVFSGTPRAPVLGNNGGSGTTGGTGFMVVGGATPGLPAYGPGLSGGDRIQTTGANSSGVFIYAEGRAAAGAGWTNVAMVMDTLDRIYVNGAEDITGGFGYYSQLRTSAGTQTTGAYQLCGSATGTAVSSYYAGSIIGALFYNRVLAPLEVMQNAIAMCQDAVGRGMMMICPNEPQVVNFATDNSNRLVTDGDSITAGQGITTPFPVLLTLNDAYSVSNQGISGVTMSALVPFAVHTVDPFLSVSAPKSILTVWAGTNDNCTPSATAVFQNLAQYIRARKAAGWQKVIPVTMISRATPAEDTCKNSYNTLIRAYKWPDGLIDMAADPNLGADGAATAGGNTFFQNLGIHPTQYAEDNDIVPIMQRAVNRAYGNLDFSTANVYASAAAAATATTAGSEATNTVTITFGATPANCVVGSTITMAGITPAGYNGNFLVLTRSATQVTYFDVSGLGAITVQGTGVCPQQVDSDVYTVLNFGAGNFTLESCQGYTGQNIYIKNINAVGSTVVPFGTETIDGAANVTVATKATLILQSILTSASAAGCSWKQLQNN
jgi:lysophospholipase L1-like esterase